MTKKVVISGMGVVSPIGIGRKDFLDALIQGKSGIRRISSFDSGSLNCQIAGEIQLNGHSFNKKELKNLPRVAQLAILASQEAFEDAGLDYRALDPEERKRFGVILGTGGGSIEFIERHYDLYFRNGNGSKRGRPSVYVIPNSTAGSLSSELSIRFDLRSVSHVITTGCTSSADAMGYAFREIQAGRMDWALAGGADAPIAAGVMKGFCLMNVLSSKWNEAPEKASRPYSLDRDGFVLGEGSWMFVLEEKENAKRRGVHPYAQILGYGSSCEAFDAVRLEEQGNGNFEAMRRALDEAGLAPEAMDYVNLHGTSTQLNDRVETRAMKLLFGKKAFQIPMSSTKSMIGHPQGASGAAGTAATLLMASRGLIHPTINLEHFDPECNLDYVPHTTRKKEIRYALCNTLGFGSKCSALILENLRRASDG